MPTARPITLAAAQIASIRGDVAANLETHRRAMEMAAKEGVDILVFPELSVTGYELDLAEALQASPNDPIFKPLQDFARNTGMLAYLGMPVRAASGKPHIGAVILGGEKPMSYAKMHVHESEDTWFQSGVAHCVTPWHGWHSGCAICADLTHPSHAAGMKTAGADIYACGALISAAGFVREEPMLQGYARDHGMAVIFANHSAPSGAYVPVGKSSVWAPGGKLVIQADGVEDALVIAAFDGDRWQGKTSSL